MGGGRWRLARAAAAQGRLLFWKVHLFLPLQGIGWGKYREVWPSWSPDIQLFAQGGFGGGRGTGGAGAARAMAGRECAASALGSSPPVRGAWLGADMAERARVDTAASWRWWVSLESARVKSLTF